MTVVDLAAEMRRRDYSLCGARDSLHSLGVGGGPAGPVAYVGLWRSPEATEIYRRAGSGLILAVDVSTGTGVGRAALEGVPEQLVVAPAPDRVGERLYVVEGFPGPEVRNPGEVGGLAPHWRLLGMDAVTLAVQQAYALDEEPLALAVAPGGDRAYALTMHSARQTAIVELDLLMGSARRLALLPGQSLGNLVVTEQRVYAPHTFGNEVWVVDRRHGRVTQTIPAGRHPLALALGPAGGGSAGQ
jgi:DNA-binding beta-propeller fold protein YncE